MVDEADRFEEIVANSVKLLPWRLRKCLDNVDIVVQDRPTPNQRKSAGIGGGYDLLGLYEGIPLSVRSTGYSMVLPDKITIFREPLERLGLTEGAMEEKIAQVVHHELAHHFGIDDERLDEIEHERRNKKRK
ncbi:MAG: metallopeptidase family protein [Dehalococcoidia bacterium]|nr:metallopeptidase family protein [Dehalococcoidia bacterium]MDZ4246686.1 metallopeptidase family protein [Dehalococcoidia bacterium]